jgi:predicted permease
LIILTIGLAVGASATMATVVDWLLLHPVPGVEDPSRVVRIYGRGFWTAITRSWPDYLDLRDNARSLQSVAAFQPSISLVLANGVHRIRVERVTSNYFQTLGVAPQAGRLLRPELDLPDAAVAVVSGAFWRGALNGDPQAIGSIIRLGTSPLTIVGIAPDGFQGVDPQAASLWTPLGNPVRDRGNYSAVNIIACLRDGVSTATADIDANQANLRGWQADGQKVEGPLMRLGALSLTQGPAAPKEVTVSVWVAAVTGLVLLIACANVTQLLLARALRRSRETAIHLALGANANRLMRFWLTESVLFAAGGGVIALVIVFYLAPQVYRHILPDMPELSRTFDFRQLSLTMLITAACGFLCGWLPARQSLRFGAAAALQSGGPHLTRDTLRWRSSLVVSQIALTFVLLIGAALFVRSMLGVQAIDPGFPLAQLVSIQLDASATPRIDAASYAQAMDRLAARARQVSGVAAAGTIHTVPGQSAWRTRFYLAGKDPNRFDNEGGGIVNRISTFSSPEAMQALGLKLVAGRFFIALDRADSAPVAIVNQQLAKEIWPNTNAVGQCLQIMKPGAACTQVVGIVNDTRVENWFDDAPAQYYLPLAQPVRQEQPTAIIVRVNGNAADYAVTLQRQLQGHAPSLALVEARPVAAAIDPILRPWRLAASAFLSFGLLALVIAAAGLFGLLTYITAQRRHEWCVRRAMGAGTGDIARRVYQSMLRLAVPGVALGTLLSLAAGRLVDSFLFHVSADDVLTHLLVAATMLLVVSAATIGPIRRSLSLDIARQLKQD